MVLICRLLERSCEERVGGKGFGVTRSRRVHELLVNAALLLLLLNLPGWRQRFLPNASFVEWTGLSIQTASAMVGVWARRHLGSQWSGKITIKVDQQLIQSGPYRTVRHPIYTAMLGMFFGAALVSGQLHAHLGLVMATLAYWRKMRLEEGALKEAFGPAYETYRSNTWALVPGLL